MAKSKKSNISTVSLGFEDELITEKHKPVLNYTTNKIGGLPDWPGEGIKSPTCQLCGLIQPLVVQIYAPLENSPYHRTLYVFGCINPNCWNQNQSWTCLRSQVLDTEYECTTQSAAVSNNPKTVTTDWCTGAADWDDDNGNFENGNIIVDFPAKNQMYNSDESDDSLSLSYSLGNLNVNECNANWGGATANSDKNSGAVGKQTSPSASAEIECDESEVVSIDTPTAPQRDLIALLQESAPVPYHLRTREGAQNSIFFIPYFIYVGEESHSTENVHVSDHVRDLVQEYQRNNGEFLMNSSQDMQSGDTDTSTEKYEKTAPAHGDAMFHQFVTKIQTNPGQILRYSRDKLAPLLLYPVNEHPKNCNYCGGEVIFEMQILPTLVSKLQLPEQEGTHLEFGTVLIYTCFRSCWATDEKWREEKVIVQMEGV